MVELPAPKIDKLTATGFEHIEIVCDVSFEFLISKYDYLNFDLNGLEKDFNKELEICLGERNLKFHHASLESVIRLELNKKVWAAIGKLNILKDFKMYQPLIAGTFPLGIDTPQSDVDIVMNSNDLKNLELILRTRLSSMKDFKICKTTVDGLATLICNFDFDSVPFEIFAQDKESVRQKAFLHFIIEERLLKLTNNNFKIRLIELRRDFGMKTEPAFAKALGLDEDPYQVMLDLQNKSDADLLKIIPSKYV